jgi:hypothetical protein
MMFASYRNIAAVLTLVVACYSVSSTHATTISVTNPSFESPGLSPATAGSPTGWNVAFAANGAAGEFRPASSPMYSNQVGNQLGFAFTRNTAGSMGALYQDVSTIAEGTYRLTIALAAQPSASPVAAPFSVNFEAVGGGTATALLSANAFPRSTFNSSTLTDIVATAVIPAGSPNLGRTLRIVLVDNTLDAGTNSQDPRGTYNFDNVRLEQLQPAPESEPEPSSLALAYVGAATVLAGSIKSRLFSSP